MYIYVHLYIYHVYIDTCSYQAFASIAFTALSLPGSDIIAVVVRGLSMSLTLLFLLMIQPIMFARILRYKGKKEDVVAENPSIAVLQAGMFFVLFIFALHSFIAK
jgi:hypothetical protein